MDLLSQAEVVAGERPRQMPPLFLRDGEVFLWFSNFDAGVCTRSGKALVEVTVCWDHRISSGPGYEGEWKLGENSFPVTRHVDGTFCTETPSGRPVSTCHSQSRCPSCRQFNTLEVEHEAWADVTTCRTLNCDYRSRFSIGD